MKDTREKANRRPSTVVEGRMICRVEVMMLVVVNCCELDGGKAESTVEKGWR